MNEVGKYFALSDKQQAQFSALPDLYAEWNAKINVISRKDMDQFAVHHVLHSLAIAKYTPFAPSTKIIDVGTGGGFPGIPLAIFFPEVEFLLIDSIGKKIKVVEAVAKALGLSNLRARQERSENVKAKFDFVVSRAVTAFPDFVKLTRHLVSAEHRNAVMNGIIYLKGGDFQDEIKPFGHSVITCDISAYFEEEYFLTKKFLHLGF